MSIYNRLINLKKLVDDCEEAIKEGKLATSTGSIELAIKFLSMVKNIASSLQPLLTETRDILARYNQDDKLIRYTSVYYRTLVLVSIPYIVMILGDLKQLLDRQGYERNASEVQHLISDFEDLLNTLRQR